MQVWAAELEASRCVTVLRYSAVYPLPIISTQDTAGAADLEGLRIRAARSVQSSLLEAIGAVPALFASGDMNNSLVKRSIDAISVGQSVIAAFKLAEAGDQITEDDLGGLTFATMMIQDAVDDLSEGLLMLNEESSAVAESRRITERLVATEAGVRANLEQSGLDFTVIDRAGALVEGTVEGVTETQRDAKKGRAFLAALKMLCPAWGRCLATRRAIPLAAFRASPCRRIRAS